MASDTLTAGQAASRAGITRKALRLYVAKGLVDEPPRTPAGYRLYGADDARVNATIPAAEVEMKKAGKSYAPNLYEGRIAPTGETITLQTCTGDNQRVRCVMAR